MTLSEAFNPVVSVNYANSAQLIHKRIAIIMVLLVLIFVTLGFSLAQSKKGAHLHELNSLHLKHVLALNQHLLGNPLLNSASTEQLINIVRLVQKQPMECLKTTNALDRWLMRLTGAYEAITICQRDIDQGTQTLSMLAAYRNGDISETAMRSALEEACRIFSANSERFIVLISQVVKNIMLFTLLVAGTLGGMLLVGISIMARRIILAANGMEDTSRALALSENKNKQLAYTDYLTGLPNRNAFKLQLQQRTLQVQQQGGQFSLFFIDLDHFKNINDTLGHLTGDQLLQQAGQRLLDIIGNREDISRLGGDEFTVLSSVSNESHDITRQTAQKLLDALSKPFNLDHIKAYLTASIGITHYPHDTQDVNNLPIYADLAMYHAKNNGKNKYEFFCQSMLARVHQRLELEDHLRGALERGEFTLHYQPLVRLHDMRTVGAEALIRWRKSDGTQVAPDEFIFVAEETGQILPIGAWVLDQACAQCQTWRAQGSPDFRISINVSVRQLKGDHFPILVAQTLQKYQLPSDALDIEVTESLMAEDDEQVIQNLVALAATGVRLLLDDFGTGYSSFSYLQTLPFEVLKIDRSFIQTATFTRDKQNIASSIIAMSHQLNLQVIAEGVETQSALEHLRAQKCEFAQGYFLDKPMPAEQFNIHGDYQSQLYTTDA